MHGNKITSSSPDGPQVKRTSSSNILGPSATCPSWSADDVSCHCDSWVVCGRPGLMGQRPRLILRLRLRQLGTHFFSDLLPGDAGAGAADPCFLCKERNQEQRNERRKCDWVFVLAVTRQYLIINSRLLCGLYWTTGVITVQSRTSSLLSSLSASIM